MSKLSITKLGAQLNAQVGATETYFQNILGVVFFTLSNLRFAGAGDNSDKMVAPDQNQHIVSSEEEYSISVDVEFNDSPLTRLLLCLGMIVEVCFSFEAIGGKGDDVDVTASIVTQKDQLSYTITYTGKPSKDGFGNALYAGAATATVKPPAHPCAPDFPFGFGFLATVLVQVYPSF
jgi:hypothetical protein